MKTLLASMVAGLFLSVPIIAAPSLSPMFQIRAVLDTPSGDSEPMSIVSAERKTEALNVQKTVLLDQTALKSAGVRTNDSGHSLIEITFNDRGRKQFAGITRERVGQRLAIIIDGRLYCAPVIRDEISGGKAEISGSFSKDEANTLAAKIIEAIGKH